MNLKIANFYVRISGAPFKEFDELFKDYITLDKITNFDFEVEFSVMDKIPMPSAKLTLPCRKWQHCVNEDGGVCTMRIDDEGPLLRNDISPDGKHAKIAVANRKKIYGVDIWYISFFAIGEAFSYAMLKNKCGVLHSSSIILNGSAIAFSAKSGTGKSTHTGLWREMLGERAVMINDDKPLIAVSDSAVTAYGTPWDGKHRLSTNTGAPLKAVCILERSEENRIAEITKSDCYNMLVQQVYKPTNPQKLIKTLQLIDRLTENVKLFRLGCNMKPEAAEISFGKMSENT